MIDEDALLKLAIANLQQVLKFDPYKKYPGIDNREDFKKLMENDPAFNTLGLNDERYILARIGGNLITSLHRKVGDMYEELFAELLKQKFSLQEDDLHFSVDITIGDRTQKRSTDGLIPKSKLHQNLPNQWLQYEGVGFEIRSCYQIGDSKRIQADYDMSLALKAQNILPVMLIFCNTSLRSPVARLSKSWELYEGQETFKLIELITDFDLYSFLQKNSDTLKKEINQILSNL
ncbi:MAG: hypothetical protein SAJ72_12760 [Jaaginema sp. PMC 1080.18]|nr:hypothetical protein [Jaaginema sp. PMC 1080.18]